MPESGGFHEPTATEEIAAVRSREGRDAEDSRPSSPSPSSRKVYVAVGKNMKEEKSKLLWSLEAYRGAKVVVLHVHQPAQMVPGPFGGGKVQASKLNAPELKAFREKERQEMMQAIYGYLLFCASKKVEAEHLIIELEDVGKGIVELVAQHEIGELVMGAAADKNFSKKLKSPTSKKAIYVNQHALPSCRIRFVCKGAHIRTREPYTGLSSPAVTPSPTPSSPASEGGWRRLPSSFWFGSPRSSYADSPSPEDLVGGAEDVSRSLSLNSVTTTWSSCEDGPSLPSPSMRSMGRTGGEQCPPLEAAVDAPVAVDRSSPQAEAAEEQFEEQSVEMEGMLARLKKAMEEAQAMKAEAFQESQWRHQAEQEALEALRKARVAEALSGKERRLRKDSEAALSRERLELERLVKQHKDAVEELHKMCSSSEFLTVNNNSNDNYNINFDKL